MESPLTYPESKELPFIRQFFQYLAVSIIGLLINYPFLHYLIQD